MVVVPVFCAVTTPVDEIVAIWLLAVLQTVFGSDVRSCVDPSAKLPVAVQARVTPTGRALAWFTQEIFSEVRGAELAVSTS